MPRIRTIKPEFPQSESMGRVSRDARLTFIELWTIADDEGRLRGNSRMLASLLFPYDADAPELIDGWLAELEREKCVIRYKVDGDCYIEIPNWLTHQKIDHPSKSKIRPFAKPRERRAKTSVGMDQGSRIGPRTKDRDQGKDQGEDRTVGAEVPPDAIGAFVLVWNSTAGATQIRKLTDKRRSLLASRLAEPDWDWRAALAKFPLRCFASDPEGYVPNIEFFLRPDTVMAILEGKYDWSKSNGRGGSPDDPRGNIATLNRYLQEAKSGDDDQTIQ